MPRAVMRPSRRILPDLVQIQHQAMTGILVGLQDESLRPHTAAIEVQHNALAVPARIGPKVHNRCTDKRVAAGAATNCASSSSILATRCGSAMVETWCADATEIENNPCPPGSSTDADVRHPFGGLPAVTPPPAWRWRLPASKRGLGEDNTHPPRPRQPTIQSTTARRSTNHGAACHWAHPFSRSTDQRPLFLAGDPAILHMDQATAISMTCISPGRKYKSRTKIAIDRLHQFENSRPVSRSRFAVGSSASTTLGRLPGRAQSPRAGAAPGAGWVGDGQNG